MGRLAVSLVAALMAAVAAHATEPSPQVARELAPTGTLRAAINYGNPVLAQKTASGEPGGVSVELARELGKRLGVPVELVSFDAAGRVFEAVKAGAWDFAFPAIDPVRAPTSAAAIELFAQGGGLDAAAGVEQPLVAFAAANPGFRVIEGRFMVIEQAMATPRGREGAHVYLRSSIDEVKASGMVAGALEPGGRDRRAV